MYLPLLFWLGLLLPGYVLVRLCARDVLASGLLGTIAVSYLAVFTVLSPVSIVGYVVGAPLYWLSGACVLALLAAIVYTSYRGWWTDLGRLLVMAFCFELVIVVADLTLSALAGGHMWGDATLHMTRIRFLVDNGLVNQDPFVEFPAPFPIYHTNLLHALQAACVQLTGTDAYTVWSNSLAWSKLVGWGGSYLLGWSVFRRRWVAWIVALTVMTPQMPVAYNLYPNQVGMYWLVTLMMAFAVQATEPDRRWWTAAHLAAGALVLGQVHSLYAFFAGLTIAPLLTGLLLWHTLRRRGQRAALAACLAALLAGAPFPIWSRVAAASGRPPRSAATKAAKPESQTARQRSGFRADRFRHFQNGWVMVRFNAPGPRLALLAAGLTAGLLSRRRRAVAAASALGLGVAAVMYVPPLCTLLVDLLGALWILLRIQKILWVFVYCALSYGTFAYLLDAGLEALGSRGAGPADAKRT